ncbi:MAG: DNA alkylation repair protein [Bacteroidales bacterium]|nr:DNA alkylation repair protein [Bacteroidales bacterium]
MSNLNDSPFFSFFKTGKGEYAEGDVFIGVNVPVLRDIAKRYAELLSIDELEEILQSPIHEQRLCCLFMLLMLFKKKQYAIIKDAIFQLYMRNTAYINNWDLVDSSAHYIVGAYLEDKDRSLLFSLTTSNSLWENRIAMIACFWYIKKNDYEDALIIADLLLHHKHDLIHKAVGWMLREIGNRHLESEMRFLKNHYRTMPRTMLRYAIEKFPANLREDFLKGRVE